MTFRWRADANNMNDGNASEMEVQPVLSRGWNDPTTWGISAEDRKKVFGLYQETRPVAEEVLKLQKELKEKSEKLENITGEVNDYDDDSDTQDIGFDEEEYQARSERINILRTEMPDLHAALGHLSHEMGTRERGLREQAKRCSMLLSPARAQDVMTRLPPLELRSQIYDYLWDDKAVHLIDSQVAEIVPGQVDLQSAPEWVLRVPYFVDANYVGEAFAREAATLFWRLITDAEVHYRLVRPFLNISSFGNMSLRPCDIMRRLVIDVGFSHAGYYRVNVVLAELIDNLESLLTLPVRDDFEIIIYIGRELQFSRTLFKTLEVMKPTYHALVQKGMKVKVLGYQFFTPAWRNHNDIREEARIKRPCTTAEQLNYYFAMTPYEWLDMKEGEINEIKQPVRRERCMEILNNMRQFVSEMESWTNDPEMEKVLEKLTPKPSRFDQPVQRLWQ